jgi:hypothetical protein
MVKAKFMPKNGLSAAVSTGGIRDFVDVTTTYVETSTKTGV